MCVYPTQSAESPTSQALKYLQFAIALIILFGCCLFVYTHIRRNSFINLLQFFCVILIVMVAQIAAGAWAFHNKDKLDDIVRAAVKSSVQEEYGQSSMSSRTVTFDTLQKNVNIIIDFHTKALLNLFTFRLFS